MKKRKDKISVIYYKLFLPAALALMIPAVLSAEKLKIVTTTTDLQYFAEQIAKDHASVESLLRGNQDPHYAVPRPDFILKLSRADIFVQIGLDMETGWVPALLRQSKNRSIQLNGIGFCDASRGARILEIPAGPVSRNSGHIHVNGNPHYWTDPVNALIAARNIRDALIRTDPKHRSEYETNFQSFSNRMKQLTIDLSKKISAKGKFSVAVFHSEFVYLANRYGFSIGAVLEEKPGVPPSAAYLKKVADEIKRKNIKVILISPYSNPRYAAAVSGETGAKVIHMPISVNSESGISTYEQSQKTMIERMLGAVN